MRSWSSRTFASVRTPVAGARCANSGTDKATTTDSRLNVKLLRIFRSLHDETEPCRRILPHQLVDDAIRDDLIGDLYPKQASRSRVECGLPEHLGHHFAQALESRDLGVRATVAVQLQQPVTMRIVEGPERLLADVNPVERRLREKHLAAGNQLRQVAIDEREQKRCNVMTVGVGVGQDDDAAVAEPREIEILSEAASERGHEVRELLVLEHLRERHSFRVHHLAAQRQDGLTTAVASLLGGSTRGIAFDNEQLAVFATRAGA